MEYNASETLMGTLQDWVPDEQIPTSSYNKRYIACVQAPPPG
jgi:hypothetical protein